MSKQEHKTKRRVLTQEESDELFSRMESALEDLSRRNKTMGPYEADPSTLSPEDEARLDRWVEGYCASGHDPNYAGHDSD